jgi:hypothetical protein
MSDEVMFVDRVGRRYQAMPGRPPEYEVIVKVRVSRHEREALHQLAAYNQTTMSDLLRDAVNSIASECGSRRVFPPSR